MDVEPVEPQELRRRALQYASKAGASQATLAGLEAFLADPLTRAVLALPQRRLDTFLVNDAYKPRMHQLYAEYFTAVDADFELAVRWTPVPLSQIRREDPELWRAFEAACAARLGVPPYPPPVAAALDAHFPGFACSEGMLARGRQYGVAPVQWLAMGGDLVAFSHGPIEASSHVETTLTQLVQEVTVAAQVRRLERQRGLRLSTTELLANSLGKLAASVQQLSEGLAAAAAAAAGPTPATMLFAGRRSSSRRYLVLQNLYCMRHLPGYLATSAVLVVTLLGQLLQEAAAGSTPGQQQGSTQQGQPLPSLRLAGTLAHEVMMVTTQLLGCYDDLHPSVHSSSSSSSSSNGDDDEGGPAQVCALLSHLLLLAAGGGVDSATALCDTFGTRGFVSAALAAQLPEEFRLDMQERYPGQWAALPAAVRGHGALVFDLFATWRMDSGVYEEMATYVADAWERRWAGTPAAERPPPPRFMHSNLESWEEMAGLARLPPRIRPAVFAFGTLADGFLPFEQPGCALHDANGGGGGGGKVPSISEKAEVKLCSIVMKAVQSRRHGLACATESAGKLGDDANAAKMQFDRRLPPDAVARTRQRLLLLARECAVDPRAATDALARAYHAVTRERVLC